MKKIFKEIENIKKVTGKGSVCITIKCWEWKDNNTDTMWNLWINTEKVFEELIKFETFKELQEFIRNFKTEPQKKIERKKDIERKIEK